MTTEHQERMKAKKADRAARQPGLESILPAANDAKGWNNLSRRFRRSSVAKAQASQRDPKTGEITKHRLKTHAAKVSYWRGVKQYGVCPTRPRPCDVEVANG